MKDASFFAKALQSVPARQLRATLVRKVALSPLLTSGAVDYLFVSGRAGRFNTGGVLCVYFAEDEATAAAEYERRARPLRQPFATFFAEVALTAVLDLCSASTLEAVGLTQRDLRANWARAGCPTPTQLLGEAVSRQTKITAVRYPSDAARMKGFAGAGVVVFRDCVRCPDHVHIIGPTQIPLQQWP